MNLNEMFINSLYLFGIAFVALVISEMVLNQWRKILAFRAFKKAVESGEVHVHEFGRPERMEDKENNS